MWREQLSVTALGTLVHMSSPSPCKGSSDFSQKTLNPALTWRSMSEGEEITCKFSLGHNKAEYFISVRLQWWVLLHIHISLKVYEAGAGCQEGQKPPSTQSFTSTRAVNESQNHRAAWVGRDLWRTFIPTLKEAFKASICRNETAQKFFPSLHYQYAIVLST